MSCDSRVGLEAQKLISISLGKMAASRVGRSGASLHKSLLVASVLQRARHVFLEESYNVHRATHPEAYPQPPATPPPPPAGAVYTSLLPPASSSPMTPASSTSPSSSLTVVPSMTPLTAAPPTTSALPTEDNSESEDKENRMCEKLEQLQGGRAPLSDHSRNSRAASLKRRRCVSQQETQEAVWSILPKRSRTALEPRASSTPTVDAAADLRQDADSCGNSMEVEHITSLVSIFSFGGQRVDLCGAQAAREDMASYQPVALAV